MYGKHDLKYFKSRSEDPGADEVQASQTRTLPTQAPSHARTGPPIPLSMMMHISHFLPTRSEIAQMRERALLCEEVRRRKFLSEMVAIRFADCTFAVKDYV
jgi:hypothetical protein